MWLPQNPPVSLLAAVRVGLLLDDAGDLFYEMQGPNLFTGKTLSPHAHTPAPGAGFCLLSSSGGLCLSYIQFLPFQPTSPFPKSKSIQRFLLPLLRWNYTSL